ncbi:unnamed protein product [Oppiella nova]|uniref:Carboxylic ester hydrolase n=1 Tax=Oppiella nova TaxID=334625 RepID=A0A7R9LX69_9ACAR|nr:unnamed protein product [Oppiella nova]CAG2167820.1 unnamed protein product [Oppiella nova]
MGSIFQEYYNGSVLATNDVVIVSVNYRLGPLGFLYGGDDTSPGNVGFYDQLLGLKWVRENIHLFGGDKDEITIFGCSGGSWAVSAHILSPLSKGLFKRAIMESGSVLYNKDRPALSTVEGLQRAKNLAKQLNCDEYDFKWLDYIEEVSDFYLKSIDTTNESQLKGAFNALYGDLVFTCATYHFAKQFAKSDVICHGSDIPYVFGSPLVSQNMFTETDYDFSIEIMKMLTDFAKNGKPHNVWPKLIDISDANSVPKVKDLIGLLYSEQNLLGMPS